MTDIGRRKADHIELAVGGPVGFRSRGTLFDGVRLVHDALPELDLDEIDLSCTVLGKRLKAPLLIAGMTGGTTEATRINRDLAQIAEQCGYAFGFGSQRPMLLDERARASYEVRDVAPDALILGNIGAVQSVEAGPKAIQRLVESIGADGICVHLNPAMEVVQAGGDRNFRGCLQSLGQLARELPFPIIAKETGCGLSYGVAKRLSKAGVSHVDVSGAGGTSWVGVETLRAADSEKALGNLFWDWGIPTAASLLAFRRCSMKTVFATGGVSTGLDVAKALVLGASVAGIARPVLQAYFNGGQEGARGYLVQIERELRTAMLLTGAASLEQLRRVPRILEGELIGWERLWAEGEARG